MGSNAFTVPPAFKILDIISIEDDSLMSDVFGLNDNPSIAMVLPSTCPLRRLFNLKTFSLFGIHLPLLQQ